MAEIEYTIGVDEAGRGPLAGLVVAAAVILPANYQAILPPTIRLADSKKLSEKQRSQAFEWLVQNAHIGVGHGSPREIDRINILQASLLAMERAVQNLPMQKLVNTPTDDFSILIDGNILPKALPFPAKAIVGGDSLFSCISAASIVAKVCRDRLMHIYHGAYPMYGWDRNKGYPTKEHRAALEAFGASSLHRLSFSVKKAA